VKDVIDRNIHRSTIQSETILTLLRSAHGTWVPLPEILALGIAQYNARIFELRKRSLNIENRTETVDGVRHSWFRLCTSPTPSASELVKEKTTPADSVASTTGDWYERSTGKLRPSTTGAIHDLPLFANVGENG
jgi:hypothetical protein